DGGQCGLYHGDLAPLGRNRRSLHRRLRGGHQRGPDQDRFGQPYRPHLQVQPVAAHRRAAGRLGGVPGEKGVPQVKKLVVLREGDYVFDVAYTSVLKRAIRTLWTALDVMDLMWIPVHRSWRLNERHY